MSAITLEDVYESLAEAIDRVGPDAESLFLAKAVLLMAHALENPAHARSLIAQAESDLDVAEVTAGGPTALRGRP